MVASQARRSWRWSRNIESVWHWKHLLITASRPGLGASVGCCAAAAATNMSPPNRPPRTAFSWPDRKRRIIGVSLPKLRGAHVNAGRPAIHQDSQRLRRDGPRPRRYGLRVEAAAIILSARVAVPP